MPPHSRKSQFFPPGEANNVGFVCRKHARKPDPYFKTLPPDWFVGKHCQLAFPFKAATDAAGMQSGREYMWVEVLSLGETPGHELRGALRNDPIYAEDWKGGDWLEFNRDEILQVLPVKNR